MKRRLLRILFPALLTATLLPGGCQRQKTVHDYQSFVFGTLVEVRIRATDKALADEASARLFSEFDRLHRAWHAWQPGELMEANTALATGQWFTPPATIRPLLDDARRWYVASDGLFNPAIGRLIALWGFHDDELPTRPPARQDIEALLTDLPGMDDVEIGADGRVRGRQAGPSLDLGAMAKGAAVGRGLEILRSMGLDNVLVNAGGDLCGLGDRGDRRWRIGIRNPRGPGVLASVELEDGDCVFTSGDYERGYDYQGRHYHHIIDPRSGYPADQAVSATVIHSNPALADAASTALLIAGPEDWPAIARRMGVTQVMLVDHAGRLYLSPAMRSRLQIEDESERDIVVTALAS